jgi:hypothetical protein
LERFALRAVLVTGVKVAEFVEAGRNVGQSLELFEQAGADVGLMARRGRAGRDGHEGLVEFFVEDVGHGCLSGLNTSIAP